MEPEIRTAALDERAAVRRCYDRNGYAGRIEPDDEVLVATADGDVVAAVRLATKDGRLTLRGLFLDEDRRRQGLGTRMLEALVPLIGDRECWLICFADLPPFYAQVGFEAVPDAAAPAYLAERADEYRPVYGPQTIMRRPSSAVRA